MVIYTGGTFDILHIGHIDLFKWCRKVAGKDGKVVVSLNTDEFIEKYKGKTPIMCFADRKALLSSLSEVIDSVIPNIGGADSKKAIMKVKPDVIVIGSDWLKKDYFKQMGFTPEWLEKHKIALMYIPRYIDMSSTKIKDKIKL